MSITFPSDSTIVGETYEFTLTEELRCAPLSGGLNDNTNLGAISFSFLMVQDSWPQGTFTFFCEDTP